MARIFIVAFLAVAGAIQLIWGFFCGTPLVPFISSWLLSKGYGQINANIIIGLLFILIALLIWKFSKPKSKPEPKLAIEGVSDLEIEFIQSNPKPAKKHPCQIRIRNKSAAKNADDLKVEILSFTDELSAEHAKYYHPEFPYLLKPDSQNNTINPLDAAVVTAFYFESASKIEGREQKFVAGFDVAKSTEKKYASFLEKKNYQIKFAASARGMARVEKEFKMIFSVEGGIGRIDLKPIVQISEDGKRQKAEKAVEKLTEFATIFFQRINSIKAISPVNYNPQKDDALWNANDAAIAYIVLNLNQDAGKVYDEGVAEINSYSVRQPGVGSTRYEDDYNVVLARFNRRLVNIKRIVDEIEKYLK